MSRERVSQQYISNLHFTNSNQVIIVIWIISTVKNYSTKESFGYFWCGCAIDPYARNSATVGSVGMQGSQYSNSFST